MIVTTKKSWEDNVKAVFQLLAGMAALLTATAAQAQNYPTKGARIIVNAAPGGPSDIMARIIAQKMSETWGQQFIVENIPAGGGNVALGQVAKSAPRRLHHDKSDQQHRRQSKSLH
jgi:tripartite-type tricarboxylate transporter receptor subunit TctC